MKYTVIFSCLLTLILSGCIFGEKISRRTVSVTIPASGQEHDSGVLVDDARVKAIVDVIDKVLVSRGYSYEQSHDGKSGLIAFYTRYPGQHVVPVEPRVFLERNAVVVSVVQLQWNKPLPYELKKVCQELQKELTRRFGPERVSVKNN